MNTLNERDTRNALNKKIDIGFTLKATFLGVCLCLSAFQIDASPVVDDYDDGLAVHAVDQPMRIVKPDSIDVQSVIDYYYQKETTLPVLTSIKLCNGIHRTGSLKNTCKGELNPNAIKPGQTVFVWMNYLVPKSSRSTVLMQVKHNGVARHAQDFLVQGSIRYRTWQKVTFDRKGLWEIPLYQDNEKELKEIDRFFVHVDVPQDASPLEGLSLNADIGVTGSAL